MENDAQLLSIVCRCILSIIVPVSIAIDSGVIKMMCMLCLFRILITTIFSKDKDIVSFEYTRYSVDR